MQAQRFIQKAFRLLQDNFGYTQSNILQKASILGYHISHPSFSNILNGKHTGHRTLRKVSKAIEEIVKIELGYIWDEDKLFFQKDEGIETSIIAFEKEKKSVEAGIYYHADGRLAIGKEVEFISSAQEEVIILGPTLSHFVHYFYSRKDEEFTDHIVRLLNRGVMIKFFLVDPDSNEARLYFNNEYNVSPEIIGDENLRRRNIELLIKTAHLLNTRSSLGNMEIFFYKKLPFFSCTAVDLENRNGKILVSHHLFGIRSANEPVLEIHKMDQFSLFRRYKHSISLLTKNAKLVSVS